MVAILSNSILINFGELLGTSSTVTFSTSHLSASSYKVCACAIPSSKLSTWHTIPTDKTATGFNLWLGQYKTVGTTTDNYVHDWITLGY